ncbi:tRNA (adenosine(37)-N6)-threonylcarbamoyltransferase complex dimerization subunit type 1 TsaB [Myceligenerans pegani]|uniref:tRNA (Adenosine(37)-N6)-threonylcarbamoyltransferase complex dimerization subunit type 1 TsaB n=1 Tax=Myceligenerans pegani TaxID=2776917 RepID=A0ABR9MTV0_9MICO|nr:tRNA (adenosine(37)-N6)-threonylcarbamoyltransferase complex dimerization subunit type 1 TsaB [Myceligenerans sp. TRM 65318]MBE1874328.1 tRNA (adenosine(37)-N6)-threonylcarbamoyltransferase complex dimerization subunit type 1 TsaB [Myceligenerans sp. TRM 65318]MBE3016599.1 tRNA (adenosine(37)-N6)-threonylcarbamoyltransferase complex dimerization subunit type 1 TsaB [Myceligenerans sp. TRM 65318]
MPVLAIDTSAAVTVSLVSETGGRLAALSADERRRHAESLAPLITQVLKDAGVERAALTAVVAGTGPAPFTGLRVGLVTARTLGLALGIPVLGVPSVDALAAQAVSDLGLNPDDEVLVATDARRKEVYWARYRVVAHEGPHGVPVVETVAGPDVGRAAAVAEAQLGALVATAGGTAAAVLGDGTGAAVVPEGATRAPGAPAGPDATRTVVVGEGAALYPDVLPIDDDAPLLPDATALARLALARRDAGADLPTEPLYLRRPDVQEPATRKSPALG